MSTQQYGHKQATKSQYGNNKPQAKGAAGAAKVDTATDSVRVTGLFNSKYQDGNINSNRLEAFFKEGFTAPGITIAPGTGISIQMFAPEEGSNKPPAALFVRNSSQV